MVSELVEKGYKKTIFGNVPEHWKVKTFNDLLDENIIEGIQDGNHGGMHPKAADYVSTGIPFVMANNLKKGTVDLGSCNFIRKQQGDSLRIGFSYEGDVLLSHKGTVGRVAIVPEVEEYIMLTPQVTYYRVGDNKKLSNSFLKFFFESNSFQLMLSKLSAQSTRNYIGITSQKKLPIVLPPIEEQKKIVSILSSVEETIKGTEAIIEQTEQVKKGLMQQLLTKGFGHTKFKKTEIGEIPEDWEVKKAKDVANVEYGISESVSTNTDPNIGIPILTGANITLGGKLDLSKIVYIEKRQNERFELRTGDLLFNWRSGSQQHIGKTAIFDLEGDYTYASFILRIRVNADCNYQFYYYLLNYLKETEYFFKDTAMQVNFKLNATTFRELLLVKPPLEEQERIVEILQSVDDTLSKERERFVALQNLKKGLMQSLLTGKVRVNFDEAEVTQV
ncbi:restriction endonuclease subunit S [Bacillus thuringiensis]|uniref:Type I restriction modification DNA specificity domain-containing protein n=1 Tax=Bacillus thuringiensis subsp. jegathesan TaxID=56955 RepID=A0A9X6M7F9_BACTJ|nr:restriction endonuclease subunit S [Bacillus thuringiensis]OUB69892.1 hypothetical protein BK750_13000 [Bacillus thuringiensis serovar jegathesan]